MPAIGPNKLEDKPTEPVFELQCFQTTAITDSIQLIFFQLIPQTHLKIHTHNTK